MADQTTTTDYADKDLRRMLWEQALPVQLELNQLDLALDQEQPLPMYIMIHLNKYPCFYFEKIHQHFQRYSPPPLNERHIWISYKNNPIQWNIPFGVSLDVFSKDEQVPLRMVLNYRRRPH